jgi:hypothetical protein
VLTAAVGAAALLLLAAGAAKVVDPSRTAVALAALGWAVPAGVVRAGALGEAVLGAATLAVGGRVTAALVALSYAGFGWFVVAALRAGTPIGSCGCFGRADTPPRWAHVAVDAAFAGAGLAGAVVGVDPLVGAPAWAVAAALAAAGAGLVVLTRRPGSGGSWAVRFGSPRR